MPEASVEGDSGTSSPANVGSSSIPESASTPLPSSAALGVSSGGASFAPVSLAASPGASSILGGAEAAVSRVAAEEHPLVLRIPVGTPLAEAERLLIIKTLEVSDGNKQRAARILGISRRGLYTKLAAYGEHVPADEAAENGVEPPPA